jgi:hypothetical protein
VNHLTFRMHRRSSVLAGVVNLSLRSEVERPRVKTHKRARFGCASRRRKWRWACIHFRNDTRGSQVTGFSPELDFSLSLAVFQEGEVECGV